MTMNRHYYKLQPYAGPASRHTCPGCGKSRCFTLYVDEDGQPLHETVGRCDHESACGYHYTPKDFFRDRPDAASRHDWRELSPEERKLLLPKPINIIPDDIVTRSVRFDTHSNLTLFLSRIIDPLVLEGVIDQYRIGVTKALDTIFFQIDVQGRCRSGKIMKYNPGTGHRIKDDSVPGKVTWIHSMLKSQNILPKDWTLTQCLFGEHLLPQYPDRKVILVESEKTAIICAALIPQFIWLATGGKSQLGDKLQVLQGREVIAFPDVDGYDEWKCKLTLSPGLNIHVSDFLEKNATSQQREAHIDIADCLIEELSGKEATSTTVAPVSSFSVLKYISEEYRDEVKKLIDELDLVPVSMTMKDGNA